MTKARRKPAPKPASGATVRFKKAPPGLAGQITIDGRAVTVEEAERELKGVDVSIPAGEVDDAITSVLGRLKRFEAAWYALTIYIEQTDGFEDATDVRDLINVLTDGLNAEP